MWKVKPVSYWIIEYLIIHNLIYLSFHDIIVLSFLSNYVLQLPFVCEKNLSESIFMFKVLIWINGSDSEMFVQYSMRK